MRDSLLNALRVRRLQIWQRWRELLQVEAVGNPLSHPDTLVHLIDWTLDQTFSAEGHSFRARRQHYARLTDEEQSYCPCGRNPLLAYFVAGEQALREALVLAQPCEPQLDPTERDGALDELNGAFRHIARREIEALCALCMYRDAACSAAKRSSESCPAGAR
jgi:hypothetical protein